MKQLNLNSCITDFKFNIDETGISSNFENDFSIFAIWDIALPYLDDIEKLLKKHFDLIYKGEIIWSETNFHDNASRLYLTPIFSDTPKGKRKSGHVSKIGSRKFYVFIIKDNSPIYSYDLSASKNVDISNLRVKKVKKLLREKIFDKVNKNYAVHCSNNIYEFINQGSLILGVSRLIQIISSKKFICEVVEKDLEGANGWVSWELFFQFQRFNSNYLILRNFYEFKQNKYDFDIDLLTDDYQKFASIANIIQKRNTPYKGYSIIGDQKIPFDIRFVDDKYFPVQWQIKMLRDRRLTENIFIPNTDDYFFSLLYHCKVQKLSVKNKYKDELLIMAQKLKIKWFNIEVLDNDILIGQILGGYYRSNNYYFSDFVDPYIIRNENIIKFLPNKKDFLGLEPLKFKVKRYILYFSPVIFVKLWKTIRKK